MTKQRRIYPFAPALLAVALLMMLGGCSDDDSSPKTSSVTDIEGNEYETVVIGDLEWMAENLRTLTYRNGDEIPVGLSNADWYNATGGAAAYDDDLMLEAYGMAYNWYAVDDARGLCPEGWRVPSDSEWAGLIDYVEEQGFPNNPEAAKGAGNALKSCRQENSPLGGHCNTSDHPRWSDPSNGHHGFDEFGFAALPGGVRVQNGTWVGGGRHGQWWSSTDGGAETAFDRRISFQSGGVVRAANFMTAGSSVRCVRNAR